MIGPLLTVGPKGVRQCGLSRSAVRVCRSISRRVMPMMRIEAVVDQR